MAEPLTKEKKAYWLGFAEGYALARDRGCDLREHDPNPLEERVHREQDWKQGRRDGFKAGLCDRKKNVLFDHSIHVTLADKEDWRVPTDEAPRQ